MPRDPNQTGWLDLLIAPNGSTCTYLKYWPFPEELYEFPGDSFSLFHIKNITLIKNFIVLGSVKTDAHIALA